MSATCKLFDAKWRSGGTRVIHFIVLGPEDCPAAARNWSHARPRLHAPQAESRHPRRRRFELLIVPTHAPRGRAHARARLGFAALRPLLRRAAGGAPPR